MPILNSEEPKVDIMNYLINHQYAITYTYNCDKRKLYVDITTTGIKNMNMGCSTPKIILGKTQCSGIPCNFSKNCKYISAARDQTRVELLR